MKKIATLGLALLAPLAVTSVATAQVADPVITLKGSVSPSKGGTAKKPKNAKLNVEFTVNKESQKTIREITYFVPRNIKLSGKGFRYCPSTKINAQGEASCPKGSKVGVGSATAVLGPEQQPLDFKVNVYAGSKNELALYLSGIVKVAFKAPITSAGAPYGQKITVIIPTAVQQPAPGLYAYVTGVKTTIGATRKSNGKTYKFASLTGCPADDTHDFGVRLGYAINNTTPSEGLSPLIKANGACDQK